MYKFNLKERDIYNYIIIATVFLYYQCFYIYNAVHFYKTYPDDYIWGELFISYAGGLVRRGLSGTCLFFLAKHDVNIRLLVPICIYISTVAVVIYCTREIYKNINPAISLFIILSPGCLFFRFYALRMFGRRDTVITFTFILIMYLLYKFRVRFILLLYITFIVYFSVLIHEATIFYLLPLFFLLYIKWRKENLNMSNFFIYCMCIFLPIIFFIIFCIGSVEHRVSIERQWATVIEGYKASGGIEWIGAKIKQASPLLQRQFLGIKSWRNGIIFGYILTFFPVVILVWKYNILSKILNIYTSAFERIFLFISFVSPCLYLCIAIDVGRGISMHAIETVFFIIYLCKINQIDLMSCNNKRGRSPYVFPLLLLYTFSWHMTHNSATSIFVGPFDIIANQKYFLIPVLALIVFSRYFPKIRQL